MRQKILEAGKYISEDTINSIINSIDEVKCKDNDKTYFSKNGYNITLHSNDDNKINCIHIHKDKNFIEYYFRNTEIINDKKYYVVDEICENWNDKIKIKLGKIKVYLNY